MSFTLLPSSWASALNNYQSLAPIVTKDLVENCGRTAMAYHSAGESTKTYEATEKFIEANGSSLLWYGAIPAIQYTCDKTIFKAADLNPKTSLELLKKDTPQSINKIKERINKGLLPEKYYLGKKLNNSVNLLNKVAQNQNLYKNLHISRNILSTVIPTILSAFALPKAVMAFTAWNVKRHKQKEQEQKQKLNTGLQFGQNRAAENQNNQVKFGSLSSVLLSRATNAQKTLLSDMVVVDLGITASRVYYANKREKEALGGKSTNAPYAAALEKLIRELGFLYLIYFGGNHIKKGLDKLTKINLDPIILEDNNFVNELLNKKFAKNPLKGLSEEQILDYVDKNIANENEAFIKYAKKLNLIKTVNGENGKVYRNPIIWLDTKKLSKEFEIISKNTNDLLKQNLNVESLKKLISKKIKIKRVGIYGNLIASSFAVCYILPKIMYGFRKWYTGSSEEPGIDKVIQNA